MRICDSDIKLENVAIYSVKITLIYSGIENQMHETSSFISFRSLSSSKIILLATEMPGVSVNPERIRTLIVESLSIDLVINLS